MRRTRVAACIGSTVSRLQPASAISIEDDSSVSGADSLGSSSYSSLQIITLSLRAHFLTPRMNNGECLLPVRSGRFPLESHPFTVATGVRVGTPTKVLINRQLRRWPRKRLSSFLDFGNGSVILSAPRVAAPSEIRVLLDLKDAAPWRAAIRNNRIPAEHDRLRRRRRFKGQLVQDGLKVNHHINHIIRVGRMVGRKVAVTQPPCVLRHPNCECHRVELHKPVQGLTTVTYV